MDPVLTNLEIRVLGSLLEKEMATPEYYPLTLNGLVNACNQKTNREPVVSYDEETVQAALEGLRNRKMVRQSNIGRVSKFEQIFSDARNLLAREKAVVCILLLRGPQTIGEIRGRTDRLYPFSDLEEVRETLASLEEMRLVRQLARRPGQKEARFAHLLAGEQQESDEEYSPKAASAEDAAAHDDPRLELLQDEVDTLRQELEQLRREFDSFRSQFD